MSVAVVAAGWGVLLLGLGVLAACARRPLTATAFYLVLLPVAQTPVLAAPLAGTAALRPFNVLAVGVLLIALANLPRARPLPTLAKLFLGVTAALYLVGFVRSLGEIDRLVAFFSAHLGEDYGPGRYVLFNLLKPVQMLLPMWVAMAYVETAEDVDLLVRAGVLSTLVFSVWLFVALGVAQWGAGVSWSDVRDQVERAFGTTPNVLVALLSSWVPLLVARGLAGRPGLSVVAGLGLVVAVALLHSRTGHVLFLVAVVAVLVQQRRGALLVPVAAVIVVVVAGLAVAFPRVMERALLGFGRGPLDVDWNVLTSGRVVAIWLPALEEVTREWGDLLFGRGLYAIVVSEAPGLVEDIPEAHNMYLDIVLNSGLLGLVAMLALHVALVRWLRRAAAAVTDPALRAWFGAVLVTLGLYYLRGLVEGSFLPEVTNASLWAVLGLGFALPGLRTKEPAP